MHGHGWLAAWLAEHQPSERGGNQKNDRARDTILVVELANLASYMHYALAGCTTNNTTTNQILLAYYFFSGYFYVHFYGCMIYSKNIQRSK
jgi:hypothetical protein